MKTAITASLIAVTMLTACVPVIVAVPAGLALAVPADRALNTIRGGTPGKTISGDTARARSQGSEPAKDLCGVYQLVAWYDWLWFTPEERDYMEGKGAKDHCDRWEIYESGELEKLKKRKGV